MSQCGCHGNVQSSEQWHFVLKNYFSKKLRENAINLLTLKVKWIQCSFLTSFHQKSLQVLGQAAKLHSQTKILLYIQVLSWHANQLVNPNLLSAGCLDQCTCAVLADIAFSPMEIWGSVMWVKGTLESTHVRRPTSLARPAGKDFSM